MTDERSAYFTVCDSHDMRVGDFMFLSLCFGRGLTTYFTSYGRGQGWLVESCELKECVAP